MPTRLLRPKTAIDLGGLHEMIKNPAVLGPLMATQPHLMQGVASLGGGVGMGGILDLIHHGGSNMASFFKGPISGRGPAVPATVPPPSPQPKMAPSPAAAPRPAPWGEPGNTPWQ